MSCQAAEGGRFRHNDWLKGAADQLGPSREWGRGLEKQCCCCDCGENFSPESLGTVWNEPKWAVLRLVMRATPNADGAKNIGSFEF
jgi:hypothetical protein